MGEGEGRDNWLRGHSNSPGPHPPPHCDHTHPLTRSGVLEIEVLILKLVAVDTLPPSAVVIGEVPSLTHEPRDHTVEDGAFVPEPFLSSAEGPEVLCREEKEASCTFATAPHARVLASSGY